MTYKFMHKAKTKLLITHENKQYPVGNAFTKRTKINNVTYVWVNLEHSSTITMHRNYNFSENMLS